MEIFSIEEWEKNFDELFKRVEEGETIGIVKKRWAGSSDDAC